MCIIRSEIPNGQEKHAERTVDSIEENVEVRRERKNDSSGDCNWSALIILNERNWFRSCPEENWYVRDLEHKFAFHDIKFAAYDEIQHKARGKPLKGRNDF